MEVVQVFLIDIREILEEDLPSYADELDPRVKELITEYDDIFSKDEFDLGRYNGPSHRITTVTKQPLHQKHYRASPRENEAIKKEIDRLLSIGAITPTTAPWSSPVILVKKKDDDLRMCCDYRRLNSITVKDVYPLPLIDDLLDALQGSTVFTSLDLVSGFYQIPIHEEDKEKTSISTKYGNYQFHVMPFGLCNAPATFQRAMTEVLSDLLYKSAVVYIDDVNVFSKNIEEHIGHLQEVFLRLRKAGLKLKMTKCHFAKEELAFLGHVVSSKGVAVSPANIEKVRQFATPKNITDVQSFMGLCSYYRKFVSKFSNEIEPLSKLTRKGQQFTWGEEQEKCFKEFKIRLTSAPILAFPDYGQPFILACDASGHALGSVLSQVNNITKDERPIAYHSKLFNSAERNYTTTEREMLAIVSSIKKFRHYLVGSKVTIQTDHSALKDILNTQNPTGRIARWINLFSDLDFTIVYRKGKENSNADALSRLSLSCKSALVTEEIPKEIDKEYYTDIEDTYKKIILEKLGKFESNTDEKREISNKAKKYVLLNGYIFKRGKNTAPALVPRISERFNLLKKVHDLNGHYGYQSCLTQLQRAAYWQSMENDLSIL